jgi:hypothetical protein
VTPQQVKIVSLASQAALTLNAQRQDLSRQQAQLRTCQPPKTSSGALSHLFGSLHGHVSHPLLLL